MFMTIFQEIKRDARGKIASAAASLYIINLSKRTISLFLEKRQCGIFWIKLSSVLFPFDEDVYLCNLYNPPNSSNVLTRQDKTRQSTLFSQSTNMAT